MATSKQRDSATDALQATLQHVASGIVTAETVRQEWDEAGNKVYSEPSNTKTNGGRDEKGRFVPGYAGGPGRPRRDEEQLMFRAITSVLSPSEMQEWMREALQIARSQKSPRGIMAVLDFAASYGLGRPTQRIQVSDAATPDDWLQAMLDEAGAGTGDSGDEAANAR